MDGAKFPGLSLQQHSQRWQQEAAKEHEPGAQPTWVMSSHRYLHCAEFQTVLLALDCTVCAAQLSRRLGAAQARSWQR
jgi:hypothetical protein